MAEYMADHAELFDLLVNRYVWNFAGSPLSHRGLFYCTALELLNYYLVLGFVIVFFSYKFKDLCSAVGIILRDCIRHEVLYSHRLTSYFF